MTSNQRIDSSALLRLLLVAVLLLAAWHVASHEIDVSAAASDHEQCQLCRLNHIPQSDLPVLIWLLPLLIFSLTVAFPALLLPAQFSRYSNGARAPPLL